MALKITPSHPHSPRMNKFDSVEIWIWTLHYVFSYMIADLKKLLEGPHTIDKKPLRVIKQPPKKKVPLDPRKVHVQELNEKTTKDSLWFYLEKFSTVYVTEVYMGSNNNALAVFDAEPGKKMHIPYLFLFSLILWLFFCERSKIYLSKES